MKTLLLLSLLPFSLIAQSTSLQILAKADQLLSSPANWQKSVDDRHCTAVQLGKYSLYCALYQAAVDVQGEYKHRSELMGTVRRLIKERNPDMRFRHPIRDFNNAEEVGFEDIKGLIGAVRERLS